MFVHKTFYLAETHVIVTRITRVCILYARPFYSQKDCAETSLKAESTKEHDKNAMKTNNNNIQAKLALEQTINKKKCKIIKQK